MNSPFSRRHFMRAIAAGGTLASLGDLTFLSRLPSVSAAEAALDPKTVRFLPEIEPLVRLLEETPRNRLLEEVAARIHRGLSYREVLAALLLAGVREIQPRPVGFKFHAVLVVNSAHLASLASPDADRWLPIFWALDQFKSSQAQDVQQGDWKMREVDEARLPPAHKAKEAFIEAMENWDEAAADVAVAALVRSASPQEVFEILCRFGARDFRDIGHKAIYVANSWRTLQAIGWQHAEPVLRSLAYALLDHEGDNPAKRDASADRPWRRNLDLSTKIRAGWLEGERNDGATKEMLESLRNASPEQACDKTVELLNRGIDPRAVWDGLFDSAGELLMLRPGIVSLHAVTSANALHFAWQTAKTDETRRMLLLQNAAFVAMFRGGPIGSKQTIDGLEPVPLESAAGGAIEEIFAEVSANRLTAARKMLAYLQGNGDPKPLVDAARRLIFLKGTNAHDYKFSSAVLEDYHHVSPAWRDRFLAASVFSLRGSGDKDNDLVKRTRAALG